MSALDHVWKRAGGFAFPSEYETGGPDSGTVTHHGMSMRDYLAAKAPISLFDAMQAAGLGCDLKYQLQHQTMGDGDLFKAHSALCYQWADAMLAEREKQ